MELATPGGLNRAARRPAMGLSADNSGVFGGGPQDPTANVIPDREITAKPHVGGAGDKIGIYAGGGLMALS